MSLASLVALVPFVDAFDHDDACPPRNSPAHRTRTTTDRASGYAARQRTAQKMLAISKRDGSGVVALSLQPVPCSCRYRNSCSQTEGPLHEHFVCLSKNTVTCCHACSGISVHSWLDAVSDRGSQGDVFMDEQNILASICAVLKYKRVRLRMSGYSTIGKSCKRKRVSALRVDV